ncbi:MAG: metalloregulator ArsR/SmtB family transcription factor [Candidatus Micrarchaeota archaeon]
MPKVDGYCTTFFSALANRQRVRILQELCRGPMTVNQIAQTLKSERTLVSHNLALLTKADLIRYTKVGTTRVYEANEQVVPYVFFMMENLVCGKCSLRATCENLRQRKALKEAGAFSAPCDNCR